MLAVTRARFAYGDRIALRDVSLDIGETALVALAGPNGSGSCDQARVGAARPRPANTINR